MGYLQVQDIEAGDLVRPHIAALSSHTLVPPTAECFCPLTCKAAPVAAKLKQYHSSATQRQVPGHLQTHLGVLGKCYTCQDDDANARVIPGIIKTAHHLLGCLRSECVPPLGPVDGDLQRRTHSCSMQATMHVRTCSVHGLLPCVEAILLRGLPDLEHSTVLGWIAHLGNALALRLCILHLPERFLVYNWDLLPNGWFPRHLSMHPARREG